MQVLFGNQDHLDLADIRIHRDEVVGEVVDVAVFRSISVASCSAELMPQIMPPRC